LLIAVSIVRRRSTLPVDDDEQAPKGDA